MSCKCVGALKPLDTLTCAEPVGTISTIGSASSRGFVRARAAADAAPTAPPALPRSIHDVPNGNLLGFSAELGPEHPGYSDEEYKRRRVETCAAAAVHRM